MLPRIFPPTGRMATRTTTTVGTSSRITAMIDAREAVITAAGESAVLLEGGGECVGIDLA